MEALAERSEAEEFHGALTRELKHVRSTRELRAHPYFRTHEKAIHSVLDAYEYFPPATNPETVQRPFVRVACWNLERGEHYGRILETLKRHPVLSDHDVLIVTEVDHGMARSGNRHVARDLGRDLNCHAIFAPSHLNFDIGNGPEMLKAVGENALGLQGHAFFSRYPVRDIELVPLPEPKDHMKGDQERQYGREHAILATVETPHGPLHVVTTHLSAHSSRKHRRKQMKTILKALARRPGPALIGGDWNTSTYNSDRKYKMIAGFWRRVFMGVHHVMHNHYPYPERYFERKLFKLLDRFGFHHEEFNVPGGTTVHYNFLDPEKALHLQDWVPKWCLGPLLWALKAFDGGVSLKLDWIVGRDVTGENARIVYDLPKGSARISDHDPIMADVYLHGRGHA